MADVYPKETRSYVMSRIRSKNTKPELLVRKFLHRQGFRYRLHVKHMPGKPDIVLPKYKTVILIHGCFWHSHQGCKLSSIPKTNQEYWIPKLNGNMLKDNKNEKELIDQGWRIVKIWECDLKKNKIEKTLQGLLIAIR